MLQFYDIAFTEPEHISTCAPNPWKCRLALNALQVEYETKWVQLPDIKELRLSLDVPASRNFADGSDYHTLPMLYDTSTKTFIGDSFDIAVYANENYSRHGLDLFPLQELNFSYEPPKEGFGVPLSLPKSANYPEYRDFQTAVDALFQTHVTLWGGNIKFNPKYEAKIWEIMGKRVPAQKNESKLSRAQMIESFERGLKPLAELFQQSQGPYMLGTQISYADFIVGGWVMMLYKIMDTQLWAEVKAWHGGFLEATRTALDNYTAVH